LQDADSYNASQKKPLTRWITGIYSYLRETKKNKKENESFYITAKQFFSCYSILQQVYKSQSRVNCPNPVILKSVFLTINTAGLYCLDTFPVMGKS